MLVRSVVLSKCGHPILNIYCTYVRFHINEECCQLIPGTERAPNPHHLGSRSLPPGTPGTSGHTVLLSLISIILGFLEYVLTNLYEQLNSDHTGDSLQNRLNMSDGLTFIPYICCHAII